MCFPIIFCTINYYIIIYSLDTSHSVYLPTEQSRSIIGRTFMSVHEQCLYITYHMCTDIKYTCFAFLKIKNKCSILCYSNRVVECAHFLLTTAVKCNRFFPASYRILFLNCTVQELFENY